METQATFSPWPVTGHDWAVSLLHRAVIAGRPPHALLITGPPNVGKGTLARSLAQVLLCTADQRPCGACRACRLVAHVNHPDVRWVEPQGGYLKIDQVRELTRQLVLAPVEGPWQVAILDRFELATAGAANALLKTLEEPPPTVVLVLLSQHAETLLPTIVSRCQVLALRPIPRAVIEQALIKQWRVPAERARFLSRICGGRLGWAISASTTPEPLERRTQCFNDVIKLLHDTRVARFAYAESLSRQTPEYILEHMELWATWWRDVLLLTSHSSVPLTNVDRETELTQIAKRCNTDLAQAVLSALQTTAEQLSKNANARLALEVLFLNLPFLR